MRYLTLLMLLAACGGDDSATDAGNTDADVCTLATLRCEADSGPVVTSSGATEIVFDIAYDTCTETMPNGVCPPACPGWSGRVTICIGEETGMSFPGQVILRGFGAELGRGWVTAYDSGTFVVSAIPVDRADPAVVCDTAFDTISETGRLRVRGCGCDGEYTMQMVGFPSTGCPSFP